MEIQNGKGGLKGDNEKRKKRKKVPLYSKNIVPLPSKLASRAAVLPSMSLCPLPSEPPTIVLYRKDGKKVDECVSGKSAMRKDQSVWKHLNSHRTSVSITVSTIEGSNLWKVFAWYA
jgi:Zn ribbon nucleic-acid-binding protein